MLSIPERDFCLNLEGRTDRVEYFVHSSSLKIFCVFKKTTMGVVGVYYSIIRLYEGFHSTLENAIMNRWSREDMLCSFGLSYFETSKRSSSCESNEDMI